MPITRWAFDIRQALLLEHIEPLVTSLVEDDSSNIVPVTNLLNFLQGEDSDYLLRYRNDDDIRRALIGRLMIHAFFVAHYGCQWETMVFSRSATNKPILLEPEHLRNVSFNVSHHGNWVVFVGSTSLESNVRLGTDVTDFKEQVPMEPFDAFLSCYRDQFTLNELSFVKNAPSDLLDSQNASNQRRRFCRVWCLKESVGKALGVGIDYNLRSVEFSIHEEEETQKPIHSTTMQVHSPTPDFPGDGWSFEEALLDDEHCYAVAAHSSDVDDSESLMDGSEIKRLDWRELLKDAVPYPPQFS
ncbi:hypothetical protein BX616_002197 [Lobosporangium transversale]|uniref:holo-[acyl-carrier-protein] synthase n=1 Tax=Lobosporangium transversale TaxID=64571 RepID=A0A1Y2GFJ6_9FUNG|nr:hypothetical protein BCR41DRAFT_358655 [Lobosporangium transversale]KAF9901633.1 hypothetical protein BX616_002197 [Lobosporangium transversale]ORZ09398.1 hypothetical protein BCR41DRAFT_358655 [Lobosporangium transversale]|eukprot:XP_021878851.1 hypothetical protein BCR41DRAFT_358655 [Lobosporangium transversale]